jgi:ubiquinone/menaquinone biosynthesis C-methylase UbiE
MNTSSQKTTTDREDFLARGFQNVDSAHFHKMSHCLDFMQDMECFKIYKNRTIDLIAPDEMGSFVDVACGLGDDVKRLAAISRKSYGVDISKDLIFEAKQRCSQENVEFVIADAKSLPFRTDEIDGIRIDRSLQHIEKPHLAIMEMTRVTKPGGKVLCAEPDWGTFVIGTDYSEATNKVQQYWTENFRNPWIGRNLFRLMSKAGLVDLKIECHMLLTEGFNASNIVFDIAKSAEGACIAPEWLEDYKKSEAIAGVMLVICHGIKKPVT